VISIFGFFSLLNFFHSFFLPPRWFGCRRFIVFVMSVDDCPVLPHSSPNDPFTSLLSPSTSPCSFLLQVLFNPSFLPPCSPARFFRMMLAYTSCPFIKEPPPHGAYSFPSLLSKNSPPMSSASCTREVIVTADLSPLPRHRSILRPFRLRSSPRFSTPFFVTSVLFSQFPQSTKYPFFFLGAFLY